MFPFAMRAAASWLHAHDDVGNFVVVHSRPHTNAAVRSHFFKR